MANDDFTAAFFEAIALLELTPDLSTREQHVLRALHRAKEVLPRRFEALVCDAQIGLMEWVQASGIGLMGAVAEALGVPWEQGCVYVLRSLADQIEARRRADATICAACAEAVRVLRNGDHAR
jgi:hypothetical protein